MKKSLTLIAIITSLAYNAVAQKITYAASAGVSYANTFIRVKDMNNEWLAPEGLGSKIGFTGGISANIPFSKLFSFQPGINYVQKGFKREEEAVKTALMLDYIEVPLNIMFNTRNNDINNRKADDFFFGIGPSVAFGTSGKIEVKDDTSRVTENVKFGSGDDDHIKRVDLGANFVMGCMFYNKFFFSINYNMGLSNMSGNKEIRWKNNYLGFKVGYSFGGKGK
jgi:hypothetical protein